MSLPAYPPGAGRRLVFLHLPKTGGTTLHHHFSAFFRPEEICPSTGPDLHLIPPERLAAYRYFAGHFVYDQLRLITGPLFTVTVLRPPVERLLSAYYFLRRHGAERLARHPLPEASIARASANLLDFLRNPDPRVQYTVSNVMARALAGGVNVAADGGYVLAAAGVGIAISELEVMHRATGNLLAMDVVGFNSNLAQVYARVALAFGMPRLVDLARLNTRNQAVPGLEPVVEEEITPEARAELQRLTTLDREIFRLARAHAALARR
ncbi:sulfotransferase family protein [Roseomonas rosulenta]|uniref:sulfotransferase family 2 domain-containing protein n=1 Tax=Roseomonas rosulenta TaxID=2748667 RepID=UPI0018E02601|nr:sulfotransferase family 2 domain-containing protein [Roseomonas rosulenta]